MVYFYYLKMVTPSLNFTRGQDQNPSPAAWGGSEDPCSLRQRGPSPRKKTEDTEPVLPFARTVAAGTLGLPQTLVNQKLRAQQPVHAQRNATPDPLPQTFRSVHFHRLQTPLQPQPLPVPYPSSQADKWTENTLPQLLPNPMLFSSSTSTPNASLNPHPEPP